jgi:hypothetical protein
MGNFCPVVQVLAGLMRDGGEHPSVSSPVVGKLIGDQSPGRSPLALQCLAKEPFGSSSVSATRHQDVYDIPVLVDSSPEIMTLATDGDENLVYLPNVAKPSPLSSQSSSIASAKLKAPSANRFIGDEDAPLSQ